MSFQEKTSVKSVRLALALLAGASVAGAAFAQSAPADVTPKVEITGSNIKRAQKEGSSPVQVITAQEIKLTGATTVLELVKTIPAIGSGGYNDTPDQNGFSRGVATTSLRGLGSSATLILLNGRRMVISSYANPNNGQSTLYDLNSIPLSAIERVEVLKDGASAVYGSDAIAGVINFITKKDFRGASVASSFAANDDSNFRKKNVNGVWGKGDLQADGYNIFATLDVTRRDPTTSREAVNDIRQSEYAAMNFRLSPYSSSISNQPFFYRESSPGSKAFVTGATVVNLKNCDPSRLLVGGPEYGVTSGTLFNRTFCNYDADQFTDIQGKSEDVSALAVGTFRLGENHTAFVEGAYTNSKRWYRSSSPTISGTSQVTNFLAGGLADPFQAILPVGHPDNPFNVRAAVVYRFEDKKAGTELTNENFRLLAGLKGSVGAWDYETGLLWNRSEREELRMGNLYLPVLRQITTRSLASLAADPNITKDITSMGVSEATQFDAKASTEFGKLAGGAIGMAVGVEVRQDKLTITPDPLNAAGEIYGLVNTKIDGKRTVSGAFVEFRAPFTKSFEMDFAGRVDKYEKLKSNFVPKVGAKWAVTDAVALRGTYSEGFRAPALSQVTPGGAQFFLNGTVDPIRCPDGVNPAPGAEKLDCSKSIAGTGGANPDLKPEKSKSYTFGAIFSPTRDFDVLVDLYKIRKEGEVALTSSTYALEHFNDDPSIVIRDENPANLLLDASGKPIPRSGPLLGVRTPWTNQGSTEVTGIDWEFKLRSNLGQYGKLDSTLRTSYVISYKRAEQPGDVEANAVGTRGGLNDWATSVGDIPRIKTYLSSAWTYGVHRFNAGVQHTSAVSLLRRSDNATVYPVPYCHYGSGQPKGAYSLGGNAKYSTFYPDCEVSAWTTVSAGYTYSGIKNLTLGLNITNLFDKKAPYDPAAVTNGYNSTLHNPYGRYFNFNMSYKFY